MVVNGRTYELIEADERSLVLMDAFCDECPQANVSEVRLSCFSARLRGKGGTAASHQPGLQGIHRGCDGTHADLRQAARCVT